MTYKALVICALFGLGCGDLTEKEGPVARSALLREPAPQASDADKAEVVAGGKQLALDLFRTTAPEATKNHVICPYAVSSVMAMIYAGARGDTEAQMAQALHFTLPQDRLHTTINALDLQLFAHNSKDVLIEAVNSLWSQSGFPLQSLFLDTLAVNYGAGVNLLNFAGAPEDARRRINAAVAEQTQAQFPEFLPAGSIDSSVRLVLTATLHFRGDWLEPFVAAQPSASLFHLEDGSTVEAPTMVQYMRVPAFSDETTQAIAVPYKGNEMSMLFVAPTSGSLAALEQGLTSTRLESITAAMTTNESVWLYVPRFSVKGAVVDLRQALEGLGMPLAFQPGVADFSGMTGGSDLFLASVFEAASVTINERGTDAFAAAGGALPGADSSQMRFDRPFLFFIRENSTGTILFMGRVADPRAN